MHYWHQHRRDRSGLQIIGSQPSGRVTIIFLNIHTFGGRGSPPL